MLNFQQERCEFLILDYSLVSRICKLKTHSIKTTTGLDKSEEKIVLLCHRNQ